MRRAADKHRALALGAHRNELCSNLYDKQRIWYGGMSKRCIPEDTLLQRTRVRFHGQKNL
jgi:hypothetical protein